MRIGGDRAAYSGCFVHKRRSHCPVWGDSEDKRQTFYSAVGATQHMVSGTIDSYFYSAQE